jgi:DNA-binding NarL/FixJ family response regulator
MLPSRFRSEQKAGGASRVVIVGSPIFTIKLAKSLSGEEGLEVVGKANTPKDAMAVVNQAGAELAVVETDFGGVAQGILLARSMHERAPGCGIMLVCGPFTGTLARYLWVYGTESWSVITAATAKNPHHVAEAVSSAVHGMTWVEPGVRRDLEKFGPCPRSMDERRLMLLDSASEAA